MIIVIEGISAAGKATYSRRFGEQYCVPEFKTMDVFNEAMPLAREAIAACEIGFADRYFIKHIEPDVARAQK